MTHRGLYEFRVMPFGVNCFPAFNAKCFEKYAMIKGDTDKVTHPGCGHVPG